MQVFIGIDDTDTPEADRGTGKLARWIQKELPEGCGMGGRFVSSSWYTRTFPIPLITAQPV
jgi:hypothetical protein